MSELKVFNHFKNKWNIKSNLSVLAILLTFSAAGMSVLYAKKFMFYLFDVPQDASFWTKFILFLILVFPMYQIFLLIWGFIFGQARFFLHYEKKIIKHIIGLKKFLKFN